MPRFLLRLNRSKTLATLCAALFLSATIVDAGAASGTIVVDAGHGGFDRGGVPRQQIGEKALTLDVAQRLKRVLQEAGYHVVMTRDSDVFIPLGQRTSIANSQRGATFVSIHFNSANRAGANGIETYYYRGDSAGLAANIHRNVVAIAPGENRGIRRRGYFVLRRTNIRSVLVECGFLTNPTEGRYALQSSYRQKLAEAIARGIQGEHAPYNKPLTRGSAASSEVLPQNIAGPDFVRAAPRAARSSKRSRSSRKSSHSSRKKSSKKKSSSSKKKKKK
ncbi:MAG: N-acetylmuramoyl-L-alanine amidase [Chthoniobacterales bacterium]